jgi:hypothetical protein
MYLIETCHRFQNCVVSADDCPHAGCREAKLLHLHLKTCSAGSGFACPAQYHGCAEARQLLAHYKRCRSIRARQVGGGGTAHLCPPAPSALAGSSSRPQQQHVCLVCSLVARQARSMLEKTNNRNSSSGSPGSHSSCSSSSSVASSSSTSLRKPGSRKVVVSSYVLPSAVDIMPPPPARTAQALLVGRERSVSWGDASVMSSRIHVQVQEPRTSMGRARSASVGGPIIPHQFTNNTSPSSTPIYYDSIPEEDGQFGGGGAVEECPEDTSAPAAGVDGVGGEFDLTTARSSLNGSG